MCGVSPLKQALHLGVCTPHQRIENRSQVVQPFLAGRLERPDSKPSAHLRSSHRPKELPCTSRPAAVSSLAANAMPFTTPRRWVRRPMGSASRSQCGFASGLDAQSGGRWHLRCQAALTAPALHPRSVRRQPWCRPEDIGKLTAFAQAYQVAVVESNAARRSIVISGTAATLGAALGARRHQRGGSAADRTAMPEPAGDHQLATSCCTPGAAGRSRWPTRRRPHLTHSSFVTGAS